MAWAGCLRMWSQLSTSVGMVPGQGSLPKIKSQCAASFGPGEIPRSKAPVWCSPWDAEGPAPVEGRKL